MDVEAAAVAQAGIGDDAVDHLAVETQFAQDIVSPPDVARRQVQDD